MSSDTLKNGRPYCTLRYIWNGGVMGLSQRVPYLCHRRVDRVLALCGPSAPVAHSLPPGTVYPYHHLWVADDSCPKMIPHHSIYPPPHLPLVPRIGLVSDMVPVLVAHDVVVVVSPCICAVLIVHNHPPLLTIANPCIRPPPLL